MQVKDLTIEELKALIQETVMAVLEEVLDDPDSDLALRPEIEQQLLASRQRRASGQRGISAADVAQRYGTTWQ